MRPLYLLPAASADSTVNLKKKIMNSPFNVRSSNLSCLVEDAGSEEEEEGRPVPAEDEDLQRHQEAGGQITAVQEDILVLPGDERRH